MILLSSFLKIRTRIRNISLAAVLVAGCSGLAAQVPAFPTAEGYGMWATGGRGGRVVEVTNLLDDANGTTVGSLRWALKQYSSEPITIVFKVSGIINLAADLKSSRTAGTTIAGQTAPGDGICIRGHKVNLGGTRNMIIRHLRFRIGLQGDTAFVAGGSIGIENASNWIIDHCTFGWSGEENMTIYDNTLTTVQWCILHEGLYACGHSKGARSYGCQWGGQTATYHHNLLAHNYNRTPRFNGARSNDRSVLMDYVNNVIYNWGKENSPYGGDFDVNGKTHKVNMVNNYYKPGPARPGSSASYFVQSSFNSAQTNSKIALWYMNGNYMEGSANVAKNTDNTLGLDAHYYTDRGILKESLISAESFVVPDPVNTESAEGAYTSVLAKAGAFPRDTVDRRIINEVSTGTASGMGTVPSYTNSSGTVESNPFLGIAKGIIDNPLAVGGYPEYKTYNTIEDNDHDGMDDAWETLNGLDPANADDRNKMTKSGYTCLEVYLNSLVGENTDLDFTISEKKVHNLVVAKDGTGDFTTINEAINAAPDNGQRTTILIKRGLYIEKVFIGDRYVTSNKIISLIGEQVDSVIIQWDDYNGKTITYPGKTGTITADGMTCPTMTVTSPDFYMENITVKNPSTTAQAVALYQTGDRQILKNCKILGNQDTHRTKKGRRYFYYDCTIEGGVDFIYAGGTCYFYKCKIVSNRGGYITAPEDITYVAKLATGRFLRYGFFFKDCDLVAGENVGDGSVYLGRPWGPECGSVFLNCRLGSHISPKGWTTMGAGNEKTACFAEYKSMNANGTALTDVSQRIDWSMQLTTDEVNNFMLLSKINAVITSPSFDPVPSLIAPTPPTGLTVSGSYLKWTAVDDAIGYVVYANNQAIGFNTTAHYSDTLSYQSAPVYSVRAVGVLGNLSLPNGSTGMATAEDINKAINTIIVGKTELSVKNSPNYIIRDQAVWFDQPAEGSVFTLTGQQVSTFKSATRYDLNQLQKGHIYLFRVSDNKNQTFTFKMISK